MYVVEWAESGKQGWHIIHKAESWNFAKGQSAADERGWRRTEIKEEKQAVGTEV